MTLFPCNECAKVIIQVWAFLPHKSSFLLHGNQPCYTYSNGLFPHCRSSVFSFWQAGIAEVVYFADKGVHTDNKIGGNETAYVASRKLLAMAGVKVSLPSYPLLLHCVHFKCHL